MSSIVIQVKQTFLKYETMKMENININQQTKLYIV